MGGPWQGGGKEGGGPLSVPWGVPRGAPSEWYGDLMCNVMGAYIQLLNRYHRLSPSITVYHRRPRETCDILRAHSLYGTHLRARTTHNCLGVQDDHVRINLNKTSNYHKPHIWRETYPRNDPGGSPQGGAEGSPRAIPPGDPPGGSSGGIPAGIPRGDTQGGQPGGIPPEIPQEDTPGGFPRGTCRGILGGKTPGGGPTGGSWPKKTRDLLGDPLERSRGISPRGSHKGICGDPLGDPPGDALKFVALTCW